MADIANVQRALFDRLEALVLSPALEIAWPEPTRTFIPPASGKYLEVQFMPNRPRFEGIDGGVLDQGLLRVTVVWPKNQGEAAPFAVAGLVRAHFTVEPVLSLFYGGTKTKITGQPWIAAPLREPSEVRFPVTIPWTA